MALAWMATALGLSGIFLGMALQGKLRIDAGLDAFQLSQGPIARAKGVRELLEARVRYGEVPAGASVAADYGGWHSGDRRQLRVGDEGQSGGSRPRRNYKSQFARAYWVRLVVESTDGTSMLGDLGRARLREVQAGVRELPGWGALCQRWGTGSCHGDSCAAAAGGCSAAAGAEFMSVLNYGAWGQRPLGANATTAQLVDSLSHSIYNSEGPDSGLWPVVDGLVSANFSSCQQVSLATTIFFPLARSGSGSQDEAVLRFLDELRRWVNSDPLGQSSVLSFDVDGWDNIGRWACARERGGDCERRDGADFVRFVCRGVRGKTRPKSWEQMGVVRPRQRATETACVVPAPQANEQFTQTLMSDMYFALARGWQRAAAQPARRQAPRARLSHCAPPPQPAVQSSLLTAHGSPAGLAAVRTVPATRHRRATFFFSSNPPPAWLTPRCVAPATRPPARPALTVPPQTRHPPASHSQRSSARPNRRPPCVSCC